MYIISSLKLNIFWFCFGILFTLLFVLNLLSLFCLFKVEKAVLLFELFPDKILFRLFFLVLFFILSIFKFESLLLLVFVIEFANILWVTVILGLFVLAKDFIDLLIPYMESLIVFLFFLFELILSFFVLFS